MTECRYIVIALHNPPPHGGSPKFRLDWKPRYRSLASWSLETRQPHYDLVKGVLEQRTKQVASELYLELLITGNLRRMVARIVAQTSVSLNGGWAWVMVPKSLETIFLNFCKTISVN